MGQFGDLDLLRQYVERGSHDAFSELVARHVDMVYASALRQVRDREMAEDVTQAVFLILLRKAFSIRPPNVLAGWLLNTSRFASRDALKTARRRRNHEQQAARQRAELMSDRDAIAPGELNDSEQLVLSNQVDAALDDALARLGPSGRDAIVLRFFKNLSFREVGEQLGISEQAAKQRVFRGVERLRGFLQTGNKKLPAEYLGAALSQSAIHAAPQGLHAAIIRATASAASASSSASAIANGAIRAMAWTKSKIIVSSALVLLLGTAGVTTLRHFQRFDSDVLTADAVSAQPPGQTAAPPSTDPTFTWQSPPTPTPPYSGPPIAGSVLTPDGKPAVGATVLFSVGGNGISISMSGVPESATRRVTTDAAGHFDFRPNAATIGLVVTCPQGFACAHIESAALPLKITLRPWAQLRATLIAGRAPAAGAAVKLRLAGDSATTSSNIYFPQMSMTTDANGQIALDHVVPLEVNLALPTRETNKIQHWYRVAPENGGRTPVTVGGAGRPVTARVLGPIPTSDYRDFELSPALPGKFRDVQWETLTAAQRAELSAEMDHSPEVAEWSRTRETSLYLTQINPDGAIRLDDVAPGVYDLTVSCAVNADRSLETVASLRKIVTIPVQQTNVTFDLGNLQLELTPRLQPGRQVPQLTGADSQGHPFNLNDHRGKYVLLRLQYDRQSDYAYENEQFRALFDRFGNDPRFFFTSVYFHPVVGAAVSSDSETFMPYVMADERALPKEYANAYRAVCLIDPAGNLVWKQQTIQKSWYILDKLVARLPASTQPFQIQIEHIPTGQATPQTPYALVPPPSPNDAATDATFTIVDGTPPRIANAIDNLHDGRNAAGDDDRRNNFLFAIGTLEGRIAIDLKRTIPIAQINTYSWHKDTRAPQVYTVYGSAGATSTFNRQPKIGVDPVTCGWARIASVDTRPETGPSGGRYAASISAPNRSIGTYRYLLFELFPTETVDPYGHTFYSEIDVVEAK